MKIKPTSLQLGVIWIALLAGTACEVQKTAREKVNLQYNSDRQNKYQELEPAAGTFSGTMHLLKSSQDFAVILEIKRISMIIRAPQSQNPSETIEVPKLSGAMIFPALINLDLRDYGSFQELLAPLGGFLRASIDFGDYSTLSGNLILPYSISNYTGTFGEFSGKLESDHLTGTWFSTPFGYVATFDMEKTSSDGAML